MEVGHYAGLRTHPTTVPISGALPAAADRVDRPEDRAAYPRRRTGLPTISRNPPHPVGIRLRKRFCGQHPADDNDDPDSDITGPEPAAGTAFNAPCLGPVLWSLSGRLAPIR